VPDARRVAGGAFEWVEAADGRDRASSARRAHERGNQRISRAPSPAATSTRRRGVLTTPSWTRGGASARSSCGQRWTARAARSRTPSACGDGSCRGGWQSTDRFSAAQFDISFTYVPPHGW